MTQRAAVALTAVNLVLLVFLLMPQRAAVAQAIPDVLRGRGLEIVDARGRVRASITVYDDDNKTAAASSNYPPVVILRLHDRAGKPVVKLDAHEAGPGTPKGSGLGLLGDADETQAFIGAEGASASVRLKNSAGGQRTITP